MYFFDDFIARALSNQAAVYDQQLSYVTGGPDFFWGGENSVNLGTSKRKLRFYNEFKCPEKIIENFNFLSAKNVYLGVTG